MNSAYEELVEKVARALITNQPLQKFDFDKAQMTYDYAASSKAAIATILNALSEPSEAMVAAAQSEWPDTARMLKAALAASPLVEEERR